MKDIIGTVHEVSFIIYKDMHEKSFRNTDYKLSFFCNWAHKKKDVCFMRMDDKIREWKNMGKGQFLYFDDLMSYIDYDSLRRDINKNYGKILTCTMYSDNEDVLFEFKERVKISDSLATCMYMSLFAILRCTGNEYEDRMNIKVIGKKKIRTLLDGIIVYSLCVNQSYGHSLNDGLANLVDLLGKTGAVEYSKYYMKVVSSLFGVKSSISLEKIEELLIPNESTIHQHYFPGQTTLFGVLEDVYSEIHTN